jgi:hypothetical protein
VEAESRGMKPVVRIAFYLVAAAVIAGLLLARPSADADDADSLHEVVGRTSDQQPLVLKFDDAGVLRSWEVTLRGTCDDGRADGIRWHPSDSGAPARVIRREDVVEAVEVRRNETPVAGDSTIRVALRARVTGTRVRGVFRYVKQRTGSGQREPVCSSLPIGFSLSLR